jgi:hypothetical protein
VNLDAGPRERVERLLASARRIADARDPLGIEARATLPVATGLSAAGVELALTMCLETAPSELELSRLLASVAPAPRAHVLLSANVFVAAHRAIALALAASPVVFVRPSRREPIMTTLLEKGARRSFHVVRELDPWPGDHVFAYGSDDALRTVIGAFPSSVVVHAHGSGIGIAVVALGRAGDTEIEEIARRLVADVVAFDQRGCLSPRLCAMVGDVDVGRIREFATALARALDEAEATVPRGALSPSELADIVRYRDAVRYAAEILPAGRGWVGLDTTGPSLVVPPLGRNVHVFRCEHVETTLRPLARKIAAFGFHGPAELGTVLAGLFPGARGSVVGGMQRPAFDGPVESRDFCVELQK